MTVLAWVLYAAGIFLGFSLGGFLGVLIFITWGYSYWTCFVVFGVIGALVGCAMAHIFFVRRLFPGYKTAGIFFGGLEVWAMWRARRLFKTLVVRFAKNDNVQAPGQYSIVFCDPTTGLCSNNWHFFWDTPHGIVLLCDGEPIACIGFVKEKVEQHSLIEIQQIQGIYGKKEDLSVVQWERLLVTFVLELARMNGKFREVRIQSARHNKWQAGYRVNVLGQRYDGTARALKFKRDKEDGNWMFPLLPASA